MGSIPTHSRHEPRRVHDRPVNHEGFNAMNSKFMVFNQKTFLFSGLSETDVIIQAVEKYGITSVIESKRAEIEAGLRINNPDLFPTGKLSFNEAVGKQAPDFSLESIDGTTFKLSDYRGKIIVLFFNEGTMCYPV